MTANFICVLIKYFTIVISSNNIYTKLLGYKRTPVKIIRDYVFTLFLSIFISYSRNYLAPLTIPILLTACLPYFALSTNTKLEVSTITATIALGLSFAFYAVAVTIIAATIKVFKNIINPNIILCFLSISIIQLALIAIPFRFRRLKNGMPFLNNIPPSNAGLLISFIVLVCVTLFSSGQNTDIVYLLPFFAVFTCGFILVFWWRQRITKTYIERLRADEIRHLNDTIMEQNENIKILTQHNEMLSKIIHRDNKLIPAMELMVREYLLSCEHADINNVQKKGTELLAQLETVSRERAGIIKEYQLSAKNLPCTNVISIDSLISYMFSKASESNIEFEFTVTASVKYLVDSIIAVADLSTLLADLIENAIIATKISTKKNILVSINIIDCFYSIDIFDSGIPFESDVLLNLGQKKATTHANDGGSGIGMMTTFEILNKYHASLFIEEFPKDNSIFTKKVSIKFDNKNQYIVKTEESEKIQYLEQRADLSLVII